MAKFNYCASASAAFPDGEHLWFWFMAASRIRNGLTRPGRDAGLQCELVDIETMITRLYLAGHLSVAELEVLKKYGEMRRAPNQYVWAENRDAMRWIDAIKTISIAARAKGWIEDSD